MTFVAQVLILLFMTCVWNVEGNALVKRRLNTLETRVNGIEMRIEQDIEALNTSLVILGDQVCECSNVRAGNGGQIKQNLGKSVVVSQNHETRIKKGFADEKKWVRQKVKTIENEMHKVINQVGNNNDMIAEIVTKMQVMVNDLDRKLDTAISDVITYYSAEIRKRAEQQIEIDDLKQMINNTKENCSAEISNRDEQQVEIDDFKHMINNTKEKLFCPDGWTKFQSFCYLYFEEKKTYVSARQTCLKLGANVADIQSSSENDFVYRLCENSGHSWDRKWNEGSVWIGFSDEETEHIWISDRTREKSTYMNWRPGQPDHEYSQDCLMMGFREPFDQWNDWQCNHTDQQAQFVCKKEI